MRWHGNSPSCRSEPRLAHHNAHYYDPTLGRFVSPDTIVPGSGPLTVTPNDAVATEAWATDGGGPGNPQELNRYSYALNNPARYRDPSGHCSAAQGTWNPRCHGATYTRVYAPLDADAESVHPNPAARTAAAQADTPDEAVGRGNPGGGDGGGSTRRGGDWGDSGSPQQDYVRDYPSPKTNQWSATFKSEGEARALAREMLGKNPIEVAPNKWRSQDGKWQYRAKPGDVAERHVHLEELNPQNWRSIAECPPAMAGRRYTMTRILPIPLVLREEQAAIMLQVVVEPQHAADMYHALDALRAGRYSILRLGSGSKSPKLILSMDQSLDRSQRGIYQWRRNTLELHLSATELDYWISFLQRYVVHGQCDVDHIDLELTDPRAVRREAFITVKVAAAPIPISADEARRRLRMRRTS